MMTLDPIVIIDWDAHVADGFRIEEYLCLRIMKENSHQKDKDTDTNVDEMDSASMVSNIGQRAYWQMSFNYPSNEHMNVVGDV